MTTEQPESPDRRAHLKLLTGAGIALALGPVATGIFGKKSATAQGVSAGSSEDRILQAAKERAGSAPNGLTVLLPRGSEENVRIVAEAFSKGTGIPIRFEISGMDGINTRILTDHLTGKREVDVALPATFGLPDLVEAQAISSVDDLEAEFGATFGRVESLYDIGDEYLGSTYGFQTDGDVYVMFYRKSWLENAAERKRYSDRTGDELRLPRTWQELDRMMDYFHRPDEGRFGGALFRNPTYVVWEWWARLHASGSWPVDERFFPLFNGAEGLEALENLVAATRSLHPGAMSDGLFENWRSFANGNIFCNIGWGGSQKYFNRPTSQIRGDLVHGLLPGASTEDGQLPMPYFNWGWTYTLPRNAGARELGYLFIRYAVSSSISTRAIRKWDGYFDPFLESHYVDPQIRQTYSDAFLETHRESLKHTIPDFYVRSHSEYFDALRENIDRAVRGSLSPREALDVAAIQWEQITERLGRDGLARQWQALREKYPSKVQRYLG